MKPATLARGQSVVRVLPEEFRVQSIGGSEVVIESTIVGRARVRQILALDALRPRIGLKIGLDLDIPAPRDGRVLPESYRLIDLSGDLRLGEKGSSIGILHWVGVRGDVRALPYPSEFDIQLACDLDFWTLERLEIERDGGELALWVDLWPRLDHDGGHLLASIRGFRITVPRVDWLRFLEDVGYGSFELVEIRIPEGSEEHAHRAIDGVREAQRLLWQGNHAGAATECRKAIEALESVAPDRDLEAFLAQRLEPRRAGIYKGIASRLKDLASVTVHDYGRDVSLSRAEIGLLIRTTASLANVILGEMSGDRAPT